MLQSRADFETAEENPAWVWGVVAVVGIAAAAGGFMWWRMRALEGERALAAMQEYRDTSYGKGFALSDLTRESGGKWTATASRLDVWGQVTWSSDTGGVTASLR